MAEDKKDVNVSLCTGDVTPETPLHDQLKRIPFAKSIAALIQKNAKGKIVIGIEGEWGEGKTYTIELIRREIEAYNKDRNKKEETIAWMVFNPWHFTDRQHLASLFLRDLAIFIEQKLEIKPPKWRIWLEKHSQRLGGWIELICLPLVVYGYSDISNLLLHYASKLQNFKDTRSPKTLETLKDDIKKKLSDKSLPFSQIVVAVEDMDRLNPEEIRAMLQLMKMIADFPKIIYLLAYDRTHVVNALGDLAGHRANRKEAREYGEGYLTKVVQAAYKLPVPKEDAIADLTLTQFKQTAKEFHGEDFDQQEYFQHVWFYLKRLMPTLRMGERIVNRSASLILMLRDKCNPANVLAAAYLMEFQKDLWAWLWKNRHGVFVAGSNFNRFCDDSYLSEKQTTRTRPQEGFVQEFMQGDRTLKRDITNLLDTIIFPQQSVPYGMGSAKYFANYFQYQYKEDKEDKDKTTPGCTLSNDSTDA